MGNLESNDTPYVADIEDIVQSLNDIIRNICIDYYVGQAESLRSQLGQAASYSLEEEVEIILLDLDKIRDKIAYQLHKMKQHEA